MRGFGIRLLCPAILMMLCAALPAPALETVQVVVLPFDINAAEGEEYLSRTLPEAIRTLLRQEGATVVDAGLPPGTTWKDATRRAGGIRQFGVSRGADHVVWGSLTRLGPVISIDARMIPTLRQDPPAAFYAEGRGIENLSAIVGELARDMSARLFVRERVARIEVRGNRRIGADAILRVVRTRPGDVFLARGLSEDLRAVYGLGFFDDIRIEAEDGPDGKIIAFVVAEKPTVRRIEFTGNRVFDDKELRENLTLRTGAVLSVPVIQANIRRIEALYRDKNYHNVQVSYETAPLDNNQADVNVLISEGGRLRIRTIRFEGNRTYGEDALKDLMKTSERGFWSWITSSGDLNRDDLNQDIARLTAFLHNNGFIEARVAEPVVRTEESGIDILIRIDEGARYRVGNVRVVGDLIRSEAELREPLAIAGTEFYSREVVRNDALRLSDIYSDAGYAYADIAPIIERREGERIVDLAFRIVRGAPVRFERIRIGGNTKTRDKVIRRELRVVEGGLYGGADLKRGIRNLRRLDFFEDIKVNTRRGSAEDLMILDIDVTEKPTGTFSFGGGFSSTEGVFAMASITQRNLFGLGQILRFQAELGGITTRFILGFTEPWLFDIPLSAGFDLYKWERDYDTYDKESTGGALRFGYPIFDFTRGFVTYRYDISNIANVSGDAAREIRELEGELVTSSVTAAIRYDSRDRAFNPTEGASHGASVEYAGIGGDIGFTKVLADVGQYFPIVWNLVGHLHAEGGWVSENKGRVLPDYEKFYLGGINSLRGFDWRDVSVRDEEGSAVGGFKYLQFNAELIFPLIKEAGLMGVAFFDTGGVFDEGEDIRLETFRESAGLGFRWYSPMGPIRIEYGHILDRREGEDSGRWEFSMGSAF